MSSPFRAMPVLVLVRRNSPRPSSAFHRQTSWRLPIAVIVVVVMMSSTAIALHCHNTNDDDGSNVISSNNNVKNVKDISKSEVSFENNFHFNDVRGLIRTISVALPPDRDSFQISTADGVGQVQVVFTSPKFHNDQYDG